METKIKGFKNFETAWKKAGKLNPGNNRVLETKLGFFVITKMSIHGWGESDFCFGPFNHFWPRSEVEKEDEKHREGIKNALKGAN